MNIKNSITIRINHLKRIITYLRFASGGKGIEDMIAAYFLRTAMEKPFESRTVSVKKRIKSKGSHLLLRHQYFKYMLLEHDLLDNFEMAICREFFIEHTYDLKKLQFIPDQIIDCGAYRGFFSLLALSHFPSSIITAIEAHPVNYERIKKQLEHNNIRSVELVHGAISNSANEFITLFFEGSSGSLENSFSTKGEHVPVKTVSLEQFIHHNKLLLKIDIEGAELDFFPGIIHRLPPTCAVFIETHDGWNSLSEIKNVFIENGFSFEIVNEKNQFIDSFAQRIEPVHSVAS